jgi:hypothetical protein
MPRQPGIKAALLDWGLTVREVPGWQTRGSTDFNPRGHVCHHDVIGDQAGNHDRVPPIIIEGRPDLDGPLANFWLERDGDVHLVAAGRANHAGTGGWRGLSGNSSVWGTEANSLGVPTDPWPEVQLEAWYKLCAATCDFSGFSPVMVCGHKEWAPTRKTDPHSIQMAGFRTKVAAATKGDDSLSAEDVRALQETMVKQSNQQEAILRAQGDKTRETIRDELKQQTDRLIAALAALKP